jgi:oxaloacetate decarboxylase (Na+ extruding) subunit alpha
VDLDRLRPVSQHLEEVRRREDLPAGSPRVFDAAVYEHQVPGGMISNLRFQLRGLGLEDRLPETLEEAARVRADLGYPIMVTPLAQFVGSQAAINVMTGQRYKHVTDEIIQYAIGIWGKEAPEVMDPDLRADILSRPRAREVGTGITEEPELEEVRAAYGPGLSDEQLLTRVFAGVGGGPLDLDDGSGMPQNYADYRRRTRSIQEVIRAVENSRSVASVYVRHGSTAVHIQR